MTPVAHFSSSLSGAQPKSSTASAAATRARGMNRSIFLRSLTGIHSDRSKRCSDFTPAGT